MIVQWLGRNSALIMQVSFEALSKTLRHPMNMKSILDLNYFFLTSKGYLEAFPDNVGQIKLTEIK